MPSPASVLRTYGHGRRRRRRHDGRRDAQPGEPEPMLPAKPPMARTNESAVGQRCPRRARASGRPRSCRRRRPRSSARSATESGQVLWTASRKVRAHVRASSAPSRMRRPNGARLASRTPIPMLIERSSRASVWGSMPDPEVAVRVAGDVAVERAALAVHGPPLEHVVHLAVDVPARLGQGDRADLARPRRAAISAEGRTTTRWVARSPSGSGSVRKSIAGYSSRNSWTISLFARRCEVIRSSLRTWASRTAPDSSVIRKFMPRNGPRRVLRLEPIRGMALVVHREAALVQRLVVGHDHPAVAAGDRLVLVEAVHVPAAPIPPTPTPW